ncbi:SDR family oxidoreductase [Sphingoaurantiacus capsulatus]|uniref:SDR family oxidoreductase n=1 Tax=Sphingoaurantiacus capsulatus TaxID=1771310 RepID=A0ABV7X8U4_9SPHN
MTDTLRTLFDLTGKTALVTGGSRGLGMQMCEALGEFGARIIITARKQHELDEAVAHLKTLGIEALAISADLGKPGEAVRVIEAIDAAGWSVDILVNNAGTSWGSPAEDHPLDAWEKLMALNLTAPFVLAKEAAKRWMIGRNWGRIINIASVEGLGGHHARMIGTIAYNTSKGGLINFTRALAAEWGAHGITVNAIAPGYFPSKLTAYTFEHFEKDLIDDTPRGQLGGPADLKGVTLLFATDASAHITGQVVAVDGGAILI